LKSQRFYLATVGNFRFFGSIGILIQGWGKDVTKGGNDNPLQYLSWRIPWTEEPGRVQSIGLQRVGHG